MTQIVKIDPAEFGLTQDTAKEIEAVFVPMLNKMKELEEDFNSVVGMEINEATCRKAKELKAKYVKIRTGTAEIHKKSKAFYLLGGRFVDGWKNAQLLASNGKEEKLSLIANHFVNIEKEKMAKLQIERVESLSEFELENVELLKLGEMTDSVWDNFYAGAKANFEAIKASELKAKEDQKKADDEAREKRDEEVRQQAIKDAEAKAEKDKQDIINAHNQKEIDRIAAEQKVKDDAKADKKAKEEEQAKKESDANYKAFLESNSYNSETDRIIQEDGNDILYRKVAVFKK